MRRQTQPRLLRFVTLIGIAGIVYSFICVSWAETTPSNKPKKSLWELRGQTTQQESSKSESVVTQPTPAVVKEVRPVRSEVASFIESITVPSQYGRVKERFSGSDPRMFVLMQEIHNHPEVQKNNKEIMSILLDQYQVPLILVEGYYGPLSRPTLRAQPKEWRENHARDRLENGLYHAEEYLYLTRDIPPTIIGVDDQKIVETSYDLVHYKYMIENQARAQALFDRLEESIETAKSKLYNPLLKAFDVHSKEYAEDQLSGEEFIEILNQALTDRGESVSETTYPNIALVLKEKASEESDDFETAQEYSQKADHSKLFAELSGLEKEVRSKWYRNDEEAKLDHLAKALYYLAKLSKISLIPLEWEEYHQELSPFSIQELSAFLTQNGINSSLTTSEVTFLDQYRQEGETFYQIAIDRERTMVESGLDALSAQRVNKAILRTGGFHTSGISQFLRANDISYVVIAPRVTQPDMPTPYQDLLKDAIENMSKNMPGKTVPMAQR